MHRGLTLFAIMLVAGVVTSWLVLTFAPAVALAGILISLGIYLAIAADAVVIARRAPRPYQLQPYNKWPVYIALIVAAGVVNIGRVALQHRFVEAYRVPSSSMAPALVPGDWLYVDQRASVRRRLARDAVVVVRLPGDTAKTIKRVAGMPGDVLAMRNDTLMRNGAAVLEPHANLSDSRGLDAVTSARIRTWGAVRVPAGKVFVLGDNRYASKDSRYVGFVPITDVVGTPRFIYYSYDPEGVLPVAALTAVRWGRLGTIPR